MANAYDPYREALVVETNTVWPEEYEDWEWSQKTPIEDKLHAQPQAAANLDYVRLHTGFCREIVVTQADIDRVG